MEMANYAINHRCEVDLYVEHTVSQPQVLLELGYDSIQDKQSGGGRCR